MNPIDKMKGFDRSALYLADSNMPSMVKEVVEKNQRHFTKNGGCINPAGHIKEFAKELLSAVKEEICIPFLKEKDTDSDALVGFIEGKNQLNRHIQDQIQSLLDGL